MRGRAALHLRDHLHERRPGGPRATLADEAGDPKRLRGVEDLGAERAVVVRVERIPGAELALDDEQQLLEARDPPDGVAAARPLLVEQEHHQLLHGGAAGLGSAKCGPLPGDRRLDAVASQAMVRPPKEVRGRLDLVQLLARQLDIQLDGIRARLGGRRRVGPVVEHPSAHEHVVWRVAGCADALRVGHEGGGQPERDLGGLRPGNELRGVGEIVPGAAPVSAKQVAISICRRHLALRR